MKTVWWPHHQLPGCFQLPCLVCLITPGEWQLVEGSPQPRAAEAAQGEVTVPICTGQRPCGAQACAPDHAALAASSLASRMWVGFPYNALNE